MSSQESSDQVSPWSNVTMGLFLSLTLGLAPFVPEPHIWGKLKWVWGGAHGMKLIDWWDLLMHGAPWVYFLGALVYAIASTLRKSTPLQHSSK